MESGRRESPPSMRGLGQFRRAADKQLRRLLRSARAHQAAVSHWAGRRSRPPQKGPPWLSPRARELYNQSTPTQCPRLASPTDDHDMNKNSCLEREHTTLGSIEPGPVYAHNGSVTTNTRPPTATATTMTLEHLADSCHPRAADSPRCFFPSPTVATSPYEFSSSPTTQEYPRSDETTYLCQYSEERHHRESNDDYRFLLNPFTGRIEGVVPADIVNLSRYGVSTAAKNQSCTPRSTWRLPNANHGVAGPQTNCKELDTGQHGPHDGMSFSRQTTASGGPRLRGSRDSLDSPLYPKNAPVENRSAERGPWASYETFRKSGLLAQPEAGYTSRQTLLPPYPHPNGINPDSYEPAPDLGLPEFPLPQDQSPWHISALSSNTNTPRHDPSRIRGLNPAAHPVFPDSETAADIIWHATAYNDPWPHETDFSSTPPSSHSDLYHLMKTLGNLRHQDPVMQLGLAHPPYLPSTESPLPLPCMWDRLQHTLPLLHEDSRRYPHSHHTYHHYNEMRHRKSSRKSTNRASTSCFCID